MNSSFHVQTGRLKLRPVGWADLTNITALKGDPRAYAVMLGGVRQPQQVVDELAGEVSDWSRLGFGIWTIRLLVSSRFVGVVGLQSRTDGRGVGLRFAVMPSDQGFGYAGEAAAAAVRFGHERAGLARIIAASRDDNFASRTILGSIGMVETIFFWRDGVKIIVYESIRQILPDDGQSGYEFR